MYSKKEITRENLLNIWGIGKETADAILLYAFNKPTFVIDAYTKRIMSRLSLVKENITYEEIQSIFLKSLPEDINIYKEFHALLVRLAKENCKKKPICSNCPLNKNCDYFQKKVSSG